MVSAGRVLLAAPERASAVLVEALSEDGYDVMTANDQVTTLALAMRADVVVVDIELDIARELTIAAPTAAIVLITPSILLDEAVAACRRGAFDYVLRPYDVEDVSLTVACAAASRGERRLDQALAHVRKNHELLG